MNRTKLHADIRNLGYTTNNQTAELRSKLTIEECNDVIQHLEQDTSQVSKCE